MDRLKLSQLTWEGKRALVRVDFNVPMEGGKIVDDTRIRAALPTLQYLLAHGASIVLMSHLGRPKGIDPLYSLKPCQGHLSQLLQKPVQFAPDCIGEQSSQLAFQLKPGELLLLENLRFHEAEEDPSIDPNFAEQLSWMGDAYVDDAFGCAHREHSSITEITHYFPGRAAAGLLLEKEASFFDALLQKPKRPLVAIVGGAKISSKIKLLKSLLNKVDTLLVGGAMAFTILKAQGIKVGDSLCEPPLIDEAKSLLTLAAETKKQLLLPTDLVVAQKRDASTKEVVQADKGIADGWEGLDIGPATRESWSALLKQAKTIFWNGPLGYCEAAPFREGTESIAKAIAASGAMSVVGGGDSVAVIQQLGMSKQFTHISTGGGASLEYLENGGLPGISALSPAPVNR